MLDMMIDFPLGILKDVQGRKGGGRRRRGTAYHFQKVMRRTRAAKEYLIKANLSNLCAEIKAA